MKVQDTEDYILITKDSGDSEKSFKDALETALITLMVGKESRKIKGMKIWKNKKILEQEKQCKNM